MIALASDCLLFKKATGESLPLSAGMLPVELAGGAEGLFEPEFVQQAAVAAFHYFKSDLGRETVTMGEFAGALEKVLSGFALTAMAAAETIHQPKVAESDLCRLADESGEGCELFFFPRLRDELRQQLRQAPAVLRFRGLRGCVKQLVGARRWGLRCQGLEERIVAYLRECLSAEGKPAELALVVE